MMAGAAPLPRSGAEGADGLTKERLDRVCRLSQPPIRRHHA